MGLLNISPALNSEPVIVTLPPNDTAEPFIVTDEFASLAFAIEPANIAFSTAPFAIVTAPAFVIVTSPDNAAAVKPVPSPINICVSVTAFADKTPELFASLTITVFAAASASSANATPPSFIVTAPDDTEKTAPRT